MSEIHKKVFRDLFVGIIKKPSLNMADELGKRIAG